ncbi:MAG: hypothetical protein GY749_51000 [Desulfobacteraceae bacterium]|nr:hypothetical protein [Desulfobacteraceae bacterium]
MKKKCGFDRFPSSISLAVSFADEKNQTMCRILFQWSLYKLPDMGRLEPTPALKYRAAV